MSWASSEASRRSMLANRGRDTSPELAVRRLIHAMGLRYRVDFAPIGGRRRADIVFTRVKLAVFIDGCFWHGCPVHATMPARNREYWEPKLLRNRERDAETTEQLQRSGWSVLRIWEHVPAPDAVDLIIHEVQRLRATRSDPSMQSEH